MSDTERELAQYREMQVRLRDLIATKRVSRRRTLRGTAVLAAAGTGGAAAFLAACGGSSDKNDGGGASSAGSSSEAGFKDTTGTPPYKLGLQDAKVDPKWQQFPYVYKYNWRRYNFGAPLTTGGHQITTTAPPSNYDLMRTANGVPASLYVQGLWHTGIHGGDLNLDSTAIEPDLALKTDHNADYTTWTFTLPQGVKFHNIAPVSGRELTAEDVVFAFQRYADTSIWSKGIQFLDKVSAPDKYTVRFDMKQPQITFDAIVALPYYGIFAREHFENQDLFKSKPIGTGAFFNESSTYQDHAEAVRNPDFKAKSTWMSKNANAQLPFLDRLTLQYYANDAAARAAFIAGQADDYAITYLDPAILKEVLSAKADLYVTVNSLWATYPIMLFWNYSNKLFQDVRVRRALSMAIDRDTIMKNVYSGAGVPGGAPVAFDLLGQELPPDLKDYGPYYQFDAKTAQSLMKDAGYENGFKMQWEVSSTLQQATQFQVYQAVAQYWKQNLKVDVEFLFKDPLAVTNDSLNHAFPELLQQTAVTGYDAYSLITPLVHTGGGGNYGQVSDPQLDTLLDQLGSSSAPAKTLDLTKQVLKHLQDQVTYMWIGWPQAATLTQPWLHGQSQNLYAYNFYFGIGNMRSNWIDQSAPGGRGGKPV